MYFRGIGPSIVHICCTVNHYFIQEGEKPMKWEIFPSGKYHCHCCGAEFDAPYLRRFGRSAVYGDADVPVCPACGEEAYSCRGGDGLGLV